MERQMKEMQNGVKEYQQENQLKANVILVIMAQFQEIVFKQVQLELGVRLLVLVMVFLSFLSQILLELVNFFY